ncbi:paired amphipathic helix protein Sin3a [Marchantia polymorpha subsp. ruderalis]
MIEVSCVSEGRRRMKRSREEGASAPQVKRVAGYRGETATSDASLPTSNNNIPQPRLTTDDALAYLKAVKDMFKDDKDKYDEFLEVMKDFKAQRIDTAGVIIRVKDLFKGHRELILGFNTFLPKGYEITIAEEVLEPPPPKPQKQPVEFDQAINYVNKIKTRFSTDEHVYKAFLEILNMYRKGNKSISEVYQEVATLFSEHADLLEEFTYFLPDSSGAPVGPLRPTHSNIRGAVEKASGLIQGRQIHAERVVKREKIGSYGDRDRGSDRHGDGVPERLSSKVEKEQRKKSDKEKKDDFDRREKDKDKAAKDLDDGKEKDLDASQRLPHKRKSARRADELIRKQSQAAEGGEALQGLSASPLVDDDKKSLKSSSLQKEQLAFFDKVKGRLRNRDTYQEFLKCLNIFSQEIISRTELQSLVADILGKHSDLMDGFNDFLSRRENLEGYLAGVFSSKKLDFGEGTMLKPPKVEKDKERERDRKERDGETPMNEPEHEREKDRDRSAFLGPKDPTCQKASSMFNKEKYSNKPISELDLSNCERCTPSYRLLPKSYPKPISTHRTDLAREVLNDSWVSVTSGSEDYSFKHMRKNQYEESLFRCEDDRFELDMLLESTNVTARRVTELLDTLQDPSLSKLNLPHVEDHLTPINLRCIERIYGDHGLDVVDLVRKNSSVALPVILNRLKQKQDDWSRCRTDMNKVWAEVYAKNYHKSLDHRSFYFKQQDKKSLSTKALITEIKEISEKKRREDDSAVAVASGNRRPLIPDLKFVYSDPTIHEDVFKIIKYSLEEVCNSPDQSQKILRMWTDVIEPFFSVARRAQGVDDRLDAAKSQTLAATKGSSADGAEVSGNYGEAREPEKAALQDGKAGEPEGSVASANALGLVKSGSSFSASAPKLTPMSVDESADPGPARRSSTAADELEFGSVEKAGEVKANHRSRPLLISKNSSGGHLEISTRGDREEGELSPSPDLEDRGTSQFMHNHSTFADKYKLRDGLDGAVMSKSICPQLEIEESEGNDPDVEGDADDEGEESASENLSDDVDLSGNESHDADDGSQDDHEDEDDDEDAEREGKAESEGEADGDGDDNDGERDRMSSPPLDMSYSECPPLAPYLDTDDIPKLGSQNCNVFYGNDNAYVIFRLHQTLYERILCAKTNAIAAERKWKSIKDTAPPNLYAKFQKVLLNLLDGSTDNAKFEDECRTIIGTQSYILFTLDKLIFKLVKQLQAAISDDVLQKMLVLHTYEMSRPPGLFIDHVYFANASVLLHDDNIYRFEYNVKSTECLMQIMEGGFDKHDVPANALESSFSTYLNNFLHIPIEEKVFHHRIFLARNKRKVVGTDDECVALQKKMVNATVVNGLEYKISCNTSKVSYVLDTEDFFRRNLFKGGYNSRRRTRAEADLEAEQDRQRRRIRFCKWFEQSSNSIQEK